MTIQKVKNDVLVAGIAYVAGLLALLLWPNRQSADQNVVFLVAMAILVLVGAAVDWLAFNRRLAFNWRPSFDLLAFVTQTPSHYPKSSRPGRYSIPNFIGFVAALIYANWLRSTTAPDWSLTAYAVSILLLFAGVTASNLCWALASRSGSGDIPAR